jgi:chromosome segregation ATPase
MVPFAQWQLHAYQDAVQKYRDVIAAYDTELAHLDTLMTQAEKGTLVPDLAATDNGTDLDILPARIADADTRPYLLPLLATDRFREAFTTYRNLRIQQRQLDARMADMSAYTDMLATRRYAYESRLPQVQARLQAMDWRAMEDTVQGYAGRVDAIAAKQDAYALENAREQRQLQQIGQLEARLAHWPQARELDTQRMRLRVLKGLLRWQIEGDYTPRLWEVRKGIHALQQELGDTAERRTRLAQAQIEAPKRFEGYDGRIAELRTRIAGLQQRLAAAVLQHERFLQALIREELDHHKRELQSYRLEASYALARLLDEIATGAEGK